MLLTLRASSSRVAPVVDAVRYMATATVQGSKFAKTTGNPGKQSAESALASMLELRATVPVEKSATAAAAAAKRKTAMEALPSEIMATIHLAKVPGRLAPGKKPLGPTEYAKTPEELLEQLGRGAPAKLTAFSSSWRALNRVWQRKTELLETAGIGPKDRRSLLRSFDMYTRGLPPSEYVLKPKPPKKYRGWGPAVQKGYRLRGKGPKGPVQPST